MAVKRMAANVVVEHLNLVSALSNSLANSLSVHDVKPTGNND